MQTSFSRTDDTFEFRTKGSFRCTRRNEKLLCVMILAPLFAILTWLAYWIACHTVYTLFWPAFLIFMFPVMLVVATTFNFITGGDLYHYEADSEEFCITDPKGLKTVFYYREVEDISYRTKTLFLKERGYTVTIRTKYRTFVYEYIYTKNKVWRETADTPFHIIEERALQLKAD